MFDLDAPIARIGGPDIPAMPFATPLEHAFMLMWTMRRIDARARPVLAGPGGPAPARAARTFGFRRLRLRPRRDGPIPQGQPDDVDGDQRAFGGAAGTAPRSRSPCSGSSWLGSAPPARSPPSGGSAWPEARPGGRRRPRAPVAVLASSHRSSAGSAGARPRRRAGGDPVPTPRRADALGDCTRGTLAAGRQRRLVVRQPAGLAPSSASPPRCGSPNPTRRVRARARRKRRDRVLETLQTRRSRRRARHGRVPLRAAATGTSAGRIREDAMTGSKRDPRGRPSLVQGVLLDVTERRRAEQQLARDRGPVSQRSSSGCRR